MKDVEDEAVQDLRHHMGAPCAASYGGTVWGTVWGHHWAPRQDRCPLLTTTHYCSLRLTTTHYYYYYYYSLPLAHLAIVDLRVVGVLCEGEVPYGPLAEAVIPVEEGEERQVGLVPWCEC